MIRFRLFDRSKIRPLFKCASIYTNYFLNKFILKRKTLKTNTLTPEIISPKKILQKMFAQLKPIPLPLRHGKRD